MSNAIKISESVKKRLSIVKEDLKLKSYDDTLVKILDFIKNNNFDLSRNYSDDWHSIIENSNQKTLKRFDDVIKIIRNIENNILVPNFNLTTEMNAIMNNQMQDEIIQEIKSDLLNNGIKFKEKSEKEILESEKENELKKEIENLKLKLQKTTESKNYYSEQLSNIRPLINELTQSISFKVGMMGSKAEIKLTPERFNDIVKQINK